MMQDKSHLCRKSSYIPHLNYQTYLSKGGTMYYLNKYLITLCFQHCSDTCTLKINDARQNRQNLCSPTISQKSSCFHHLVEQTYATNFPNPVLTWGFHTWMLVKVTVELCSWIAKFKPELHAFRFELFILPLYIWIRCGFLAPQPAWISNNEYG